MVLLSKVPPLENFKKACKSHFNTELECDVLTGEGGFLPTKSRYKIRKFFYSWFFEGVASAKRKSHVSEPV